MKRVDRAIEHAKEGIRIAADGYVISERLQIELREKRLRNTWRPAPFLAPAPGFENPAGRVHSDPEILLALASLVRPHVRAQLLKELPPEPADEIAAQEMPAAPNITALNRALAAVTAEPGKSNRLIAKDIGVDKDTVRAARTKLAADSPVDANAARVGADGRTRKPPKRTDGWRVLPSEGAGECDYNPEFEPAYQGMSDAELRRQAATAQVNEATRLAREHAMLRPTTKPEEISQRRIKDAEHVIAEWRRTVARLKTLRNQRRRK